MTGSKGWDLPVCCVVLPFEEVLDACAGTAGGYEGFLALNLGAAARRLDAMFPVVPEAAGVVRALGRMGLEVLVTTGADTGEARRVRDAQLAAAGVRGLLTDVVHADRLPGRLPDPAFPRGLLSAAGHRPDQICYVDRDGTDVAPVLAAGIRAVLIAHAGAPAKPSHHAPGGVPVVPSLLELPGAINAISEFQGGSGE